MMRCAQCGHDNSPTAKFCEECGRRIVDLISVSDQRRNKSAAHISEAERRQITVMFCDLVGSTTLSERLDPEDLSDVIRSYQLCCEEIVRQFNGTIARYTGDGILIYFGYPQAHEYDAERAVRAGIGIVQAVSQLSPYKVKLQTRIGIATGLVVVGEVIGEGWAQEQAIRGETPNLAARLQSLAKPDTVVIASNTHRLLAGLFDCKDLGSCHLKGFSEPIQALQVIGLKESDDRLNVSAFQGLAPLVGRDDEINLLLQRWGRLQEKAAQTVLISGEPGIGKSRLVRELQQRLIEESYTKIEIRCSPYHQNSAFHPLIEHFRRLLQIRRDDSVEEKIGKVEHTLSQYRAPLEEVAPLFASLLSLPLPEKDYPPLTLSPERQRYRTQEALLNWFLEEAKRQPVLAVWEDLHWADPSTLEVLDLFIDQASKAPVFTLLTFRPEFNPAWSKRTDLTQIRLDPLSSQQVAEVVEGVVGGKVLPVEVLQQIVSKTDGVPLFAEELTKTLLESGLLRAKGEHYELTEPLPALTIPETLQESLMARLDRLATVRQVAQIGAALGREFSFSMIHAVSALGEEKLQQALDRLVEAELVYERRTSSEPSYVFKHSLIQDAAYQSLLKSTRKQYHQHIGQVLIARFPETAATQPELLAYHFTEAGLTEKAIDYWRQAGEIAIHRSAHTEAIAHLTKGLAFLKSLPDANELVKQELQLQCTLGQAWMAAKGFAAPEVEQAYARALKLCEQASETPKLFSVLAALRAFYATRGKLGTARKLGEHCLSLAQRLEDAKLVLRAHEGLGITLVQSGEFASAMTHLEEGITLYDRKRRCSAPLLQDPCVDCLSFAAWGRWALGYPEKALQASRQAIALAEELDHPFTHAFALLYAAILHQFRLEAQEAQVHANAAIALSIEHGFPLVHASATVLKGWVLAELEQKHQGISQIVRGVDTWRATGADGHVPYYLSLLAEAYGKNGQLQEMSRVLDEALVLARNTGEHVCDAELHRLKGIVMHKQGISRTEVEVCFQLARDIARRQHAKLLELRATMSLSHLWQQEGKFPQARKMLEDVYCSFTEGFDTRDLKEAKVLLVELT